MPNIVEIIVALALTMLGFVVVVIVGSLIVYLRNPCKGCTYYLKDRHECLFNPLASDSSPPKRCPQESWEI